MNKTITVLENVLMLLSNVHKQGATGINMYLLADYRSIYPNRKVYRPTYRSIAHDVTAPVTMHLEDKLAIYA
jgi:hypothetical protein